jgi:hypothetical protein
MANEWLQNIKVGDKVIISGNSAFGSDRVNVVVKLTATQVHVNTRGFLKDYVTKYNRESGRSIGTGTWETNWLDEATPEKLEAIVLRNKRFKIKKYVTETVNWDTVSKEVIEQLYVLLDPFVKGDK